MFDQAMEIVNQAKTLPADKRTAAVTMLVFWSIAQCVYYIVLGVVVIVLGRRLIHAVLTAWRESRREPS
ncbi:MAG TPA: hypothetical protein VG722_10055 [Tepidisphaeraceae bacterium]|nr:hypothetical protein [Tepidisphaeraceae bacterium]